MYQRIPYSILSQVNKKKPQNYSVLKLPSKNDAGDPSAAAFETSRRAAAAAGAREKAFAKWENHPFPNDIDFESALESIEHSNLKEPRVLKYKLSFADGCHILLARSNMDDPSTLYCIEAYDPNGTFNSKTLQKKEVFNAAEGIARQNILVNENGHLTKRKRDEKGNAIHKSLTIPKEAPGTAGFAFTPMSYVGYQMRANKNFPGVRTGLKETNKSAHQFLYKEQNV